MNELDTLNKKILFLCTGNSCRSQMAEALLKKYINSSYIESAGTDPKPIHPLAINVMKEIGLDISDKFSKSISHERFNFFDIIITLCGDARDQCFNVKSFVKEYHHWDILDPAKASETKKEKMVIFRNVRDDIEQKIKKLIDL